MLSKKTEIMKIPEYSEIQAAHDRIRSFVHRTPVLTSSAVNSILGKDIFFKCENFQKVGAFKFRGAVNAVLCLNDSELRKGVATHSSGNHAAALALAAKTQGVPAFIVMPNNAPQVKKDAVAFYGAEITYCEPTLEARESGLREVVRKTGATFIHPFNNRNVICGQGTAVKELFEEYDDLDAIIAPIGGGGLICGGSIVAKTLHPSCRVIAAEPEGADDAYRSFYQKKLFPSVNPKTIADGLLTSMSPLTYSIVRKNVDEIYTASEGSIVEAMKLIWTRMKIIIEPSSAVPLAILLQHGEKIQEKRIGIIITGGNVDLKTISQLFS